MSEPRAPDPPAPHAPTPDPPGDPLAGDPLACDPVAALAPFARRQEGIAWFAATGAPIASGERDEAASYAAALGFRDAAAVPVVAWRAAQGVARGAGFAAWWAAEEREGAALLEAANARFGFAPLMTALTRVTSAASATVMEAATMALARRGISDPALARVAASAATQAAYQAALALATESGNHAFVIKFRLFAAGRWPLGIAESRLYLF
jgi:hypothetical protein